MRRLIPMGVLAAALGLLTGTAVPVAQAQTTPQERLERPGRRANPQQIPNTRSLIDLRRRLIELDRLLSLGSVGRAETLLDDLSLHSPLERELVSRRIRLAQLKGDHAEAVRISRDALMGQSLNPSLWRTLAVSLLALDQPDSARIAVGHFLTTSPNLRSAGMVSADLFRGAGYPRVAVDLIDSLRILTDDPRFMGRHRALSLLELDLQAPSAEEVVFELRASPFNLTLVRSELLEAGCRPSTHPVFIDRLEDLAAEPRAGDAEILLAANLYLTDGKTETAESLVRPALGRRSMAMEVLQNSSSLTRELPLLENETERLATVNYLLTVLGDLASPVNLDPGLRMRAGTGLAEVCEQALTLDALGPDPRRSVERFAEMLEIAQQAAPRSRFLYSSQIKLAAYTRDHLREPALAARRLETLLMDLNLPTEGLALVRLTLGECYMAAGDTSRGRTVLTSLGRDTGMRVAAGHAHYHLARLDLAEGHFATARDRFAVVAMDNPAAPYANNALDLGLAVAEEMDNASGGPSILALYAQSVYYDLVADPDGRLTALEDFVTQGARLLDLEEPQHLLERGRYELAGLYADAGRLGEAVDQLDRILLDHPDGRFAAAGLAEGAGWLAAAGRPSEAKDRLERLLAQYPTYLFIDDARDQLRSLP